MAGLDVAMIFALIGAIVGEFVGATAGLGMLIQSMNFTMDVSGQFSVLLILSLVGLGLNRAILLVRRRVLFWDPSEKERLELGVEEPDPAAPLAANARVKKEVRAW
jgi:NitT/TauT family transport system permease protein